MESECERFRVGYKVGPKGQSDLCSPESFVPKSTHFSRQAIKFHSGPEKQILWVGPVDEERF
mgnify:CR=1 FL=1